jgi:hypothetical protein
LVYHWWYVYHSLRNLGIGDTNTYKIVVATPETKSSRRVFLEKLIFVPLVKKLMSRVAQSVSIVSCYGLDDRVIEVRSPAEAEGFFL